LVPDIAHGWLRRAISDLGVIDHRRLPVRRPIRRPAELVLTGGQCDEVDRTPSVRRRSAPGNASSPWAGGIGRRRRGSLGRRDLITL